ncbi:hypothetical protein C0J52_27787 [Blattella germanica]|nr:hypothetical protein C0J52_27787 [Blattella germanica]
MNTKFMLNDFKITSWMNMCLSSSFIASLGSAIASTPIDVIRISIDISIGNEKIFTIGIYRNQ